MMQITDTEMMLNRLLSRFKNNRQSISELYLELKKPLFIFCLSIVNDYYIAEDVMQDTFIKIINNVNKYQDRNSAKTWIFTIARNTSINYLNKSRKEIAQDKIDYREYRNFTDEVDSAVNFLQLIKDLNEDEKELLALRLCADLDFKTISKTLNISSAAARKKYSRSIAKLKSSSKKRK